MSGTSATTWTVDSLANHLGAVSLWSAVAWQPIIAAAVRDGVSLDWIADHSTRISPDTLVAVRHAIATHIGSSQDDDGSSARNASTS